MYNIIRGDFKMINFKEEVEKRKDQLIQDIETLVLSLLFTMKKQQVKTNPMVKLAVMLLMPC